MNLQKFVFLGDNQQQTYLEQLLTVPAESRSMEDSVLIMWYFRNNLNTFLTKKESDEMDFETYTKLIKYEENNPNE